MSLRAIASLWLAATLAGAAAAGEPPANAVRLETAAVRALGGGRTMVFDGTVEAVRQTVVAAQVPGAVVAIDVRVGDAVRAGQPLVRIDARAAEQAAAASDAQAQATRAALVAAERELERNRQLFQQKYISQAALERAEATWLSTKAQLEAQLAQAGAARTQSGLHRVAAPYAGVVSEVPVALGDMAMPGRPLLTLYDPAVVRVTATVPQTLVGRPVDPGSVRVELPGVAGAASVVPVRATVVPAVDAATHTVQLRLELPAGVPGAVPGRFARVTVADAAAPGTSARLVVPARAVVRRAELTAVYVVGGDGSPRLRQVRLGPGSGDEVEVLAGLSAGERVAVDPQAAARVR